MTYKVISKKFKNNRLEDTTIYTVDNIRKYLSHQKQCYKAKIYRCEKQSYILIEEWDTINETIIEHIERVKG